MLLTVFLDIGTHLSVLYYGIFVEKLCEFFLFVHFFIRHLPDIFEPHKNRAILIYDQFSKKEIPSHSVPKLKIWLPSS